MSNSPFYYISKGPGENAIVINQGNNTNYTLNLKRTNWKEFGSNPILYGKYKGKNYYFVNTSWQPFGGSLNVLHNFTNVVNSKGRKVRRPAGAPPVRVAARKRPSRRRSKKKASNSPKRTARIPRTNLN